MVFNKRYIGLLIATISFVFCNQVQLITMHKKSNGTLLRIVSSSIIDIENIAGWSGQENWFYITLNGTYLSPSAVEYIEFEPPIMDIEITENNESVQIGYLFERPIEDFEIFHSEASRVILVQVWESLNDSLRTEVQLSEGNNNNRVFSLPKKELRIVDSEKSSEEKNNKNLNFARPKTFKEFIGQEQIKASLRIAIDASLYRKEALEHTLLYGQPGLGKTTLAFLIAKALSPSTINSTLVDIP